MPAEAGTLKQPTTQHENHHPINNSQPAIPSLTPTTRPLRSEGDAMGAERPSQGMAGQTRGQNVATQRNNPNNHHQNPKNPPNPKNPSSDNNLTTTTHVLT